ncbi:MAG: alpha/beta hydrolase, partial [Rhodobacteraceae bacterium]|nr:alpha/beta hydrolase [Paracoccaceae bacterium]
ADAAGIEQFPLIANLQAGPVAVRFIAENPGRVTKLILHCAYARGRAAREGAPADQASDPSIALLQEGWGNPDNGYMRAWLSMFLPLAAPEEASDLITQFGAACRPEEISEKRKAIDRFDATDYLARVDVPTLIIHPRSAAAHPLSEAQFMAARIPDAELMPVEGANVIMLPSDPTWSEQMDAIMEFLAS